MEPFSAALGFAGSAFGAISASRQASADRALAYAQIDAQKQAQSRQYSIAETQQRALDDENAYRREMEARNRSEAARERQFTIGQMKRYEEQLATERKAEVDRQVAADREQAKISAFRLQAELDNKALTRDERRYAKEQLERAQKIAKGEREDDMRRFYEAQVQTRQERQFQLDEYQTSKRLTQEQADQNNAMRQRVIGQIDGLQRSTDAMYASFGKAPVVEALDPRDIDAEIGRRQEQYQSDVDRAADRVASVNEAGMIGAGMDRSTAATASRGEIAGRLGDEYQSARNRAYDEALGYITGRENLMNQNAGSVMESRSRALAELAGARGQSIPMLSQTNPYQSAAAAYAQAPNIRTAVYDRAIQGGAGPMASLPTAVYDMSGAMGGNLSNYTVSRSAATANTFSPQSAIMDPYSLSIESPSTYYSNGINIGNNLASLADRNAGVSAIDARNTSKEFAYSFKTLYDEGGAALGGWGNLFGGGGGGGQPLGKFPGSGALNANGGTLY